MSFREQLHAYIAQLEQRLRWSTLLRGVAILTGSALVATLVLVTIANALAFSQGSVTAARFALILILAVAAAAGLALPLRRLTRRRAVEPPKPPSRNSQQRLTTFAERDGQDPFIELLAGDTLDVAQSAEPKQIVTDRRLWSSLAASVGAFADPDLDDRRRTRFSRLRRVAAVDRSAHRQARALRSARDSRRRRRAPPRRPVGFRASHRLQSPSVKLYARFQSSAKWEEIAMQHRRPASFAGGYQFLFAGLPENVEYYVTAGAMTSKHFNIHVTDLPAVKQIRVTYHYPAWTGMPSEIEERGGDLRAVVGTEAELEVSTDRPLAGRPDPARQRTEDSAHRRPEQRLSRHRQDGSGRRLSRRRRRRGPAGSRQRGFFHRGAQGQSAADFAGAARPRRLSCQPDRRGDDRGQGHRRISRSTASRCIIRSTAAPRPRWIC